MATPSTISIIRLDGSVSRTHCRLGGYLDGNGQTLFLHYQDTQKIERLISLGNIEVLGPEIDLPSASINTNNISLFFERDLGRGREESQPQHFKNLDECYEKEKSNNLCLLVGYIYDFFFKEEDLTWYVQSLDNPSMEKLEDAILKDPDCVDTPAFIQINRDILEQNTPMPHEETPRKANLKI